MLCAAVLALPAFADDYPVNFPTGTATGTSRTLNSLTVTSGQNARTLTPTNNRLIYNDLTAGQPAYVADGEDIFVGVDYKTNGAQAKWIHCYLYVDLNGDKQFTVALEADNNTPAAGNEMLSWTHYEGKNSLGQTVGAGDAVPATMPAFRLPAGLAEGTQLRCRVKADWNDTDPGGRYGYKHVSDGGTVPNDKNTDNIDENSGFVCDFTLVVGKDPEAYQLVWSDEFDGDALDTGKWRITPRGTVNWNRYASAKPENLFVQDGCLVLRGMKDDADGATYPGQESNGKYSAAAVQTDRTYSFCYGKIEGRMKTLPHTGNFPAFWMMPLESKYGGWPNSGEIDIMEQIDAQNTAWFTVHSKWRSAGNNTPNPSLTKWCDFTQWHVFGLEWTEDRLTWYQDGVAAGSYVRPAGNQAALDGGAWPFDQPFYIILNQSMGPGWPAKPDPAFTYELQVDWVRVYQKGGATGITTLSQPGDEAEAVAVPEAGGVKITCPQGARVRVHDIAGRLVRTLYVQGESHINLPAGLYVIGGKKVFVR